MNIDADRWKAWEHDRWMTAPGKPGCMWLYGTLGDDPRRVTGDELEHQRAHYPSHICAEVEVEETIDGVVKRYWKPAVTITGWTHRAMPMWAQMGGAALHGARPAKRQPQPRKTLKEMAKAQ